MVKKRRKYLGGLLMVLYMALWFSVTLNTHTHIIDGEVITHSHPFAQDEHTHSDAEIGLIGLLSLIVFVVPTFVISIGGATKIIPLVFALYSENLSYFKGHSVGLRAPPVCM